MGRRAKGNLQWIAQRCDLLLLRSIGEEVQLEGAARLRLGFAHAVMVGLPGAASGRDRLLEAPFRGCSPSGSADFGLPRRKITHHRGCDFSLETKKGAQGPFYGQATSLLCGLRLDPNQPQQCTEAAPEHC